MRGSTRGFGGFSRTSHVWRGTSVRCRRGGLSKQFHTAGGDPGEERRGREAGASRRSTVSGEHVVPLGTWGVLCGKGD
ncbi:predicted protein [Streptomyces sp. C]|nr:predicted protein [Streptomyces sp. C]